MSAAGGKAHLMRTASLASMSHIWYTSDMMASTGGTCSIKRLTYRFLSSRLSRWTSKVGSVGGCGGEREPLADVRLVVVLVVAG